MNALRLGLFLCAASVGFGCERVTPDPPAATPVLASELVIFAAASLKGAFTELGRTFETSHPGVEVSLNFAGTQEIRMQLEHGAQADVFASADEKQMRPLVEQKLVKTPYVFAENEPVLAVYAGSKAPLESLADLSSASRLVFGDSQVPIGRYTIEILTRAEQEYGKGYRERVESRVVSRELNVRQVLAKVTLGEADAAIVYRSDVTPPKQDIRVVEIPQDLNVVARYPVAIVARAEHEALAHAFLELLRSANGQATLRSTGFRSPAGN
jgi:molybdate transport system substrate-binding protein